MRTYDRRPASRKGCQPWPESFNRLRMVSSSRQVDSHGCATEGSTEGLLQTKILKLVGCSVWSIRATIKIQNWFKRRSTYRFKAWQPSISTLLTLHTDLFCGPAKDVFVNFVRRTSLHGGRGINMLPAQVDVGDAAPGQTKLLTQLLYKLIYESFTSHTTFILKK